MEIGSPGFNWIPAKKMRIRQLIATFIKIGARFNAIQRRNFIMYKCRNRNDDHNLPADHLIAGNPVYRRIPFDAIDYAVRKKFTMIPVLSKSREHRTDTIDLKIIVPCLIIEADK